jgi:hypothetical protein
MIEKIEQFNAKMLKLGINPNDFFVISFWGNQDIQCQGNYNNLLAKKLYDLGYEGKLQNNGHIRFTTEGMQFTLC